MYRNGKMKRTEHLPLWLSSELEGRIKVSWIFSTLLEVLKAFTDSLIINNAIYRKSKVYGCLTSKAVLITFNTGYATVFTKVSK